MNSSDLKSIAKGFINATRFYIGMPDEEIERLAEERYEVCLSCDTISDSKFTCDKEKGGCGCPLLLRTRSDKGCPKGHWK